MGDPDHRMNDGSNQSGQGPIKYNSSLLPQFDPSLRPNAQSPGFDSGIYKLAYHFIIPVLSAQLITAPTGRPREIRNLAPAEPPRPVKANKNLDNS